MFIRRFPEPIPASTQRPLWACLSIGVCCHFLPFVATISMQPHSQTGFGTKPLHKLKLYVSTIIGVLTESASDLVLTLAEAQSTGAPGYTTLTGNAYSTLSGNAYSTTTSAITTANPGGNAGGGSVQGGTQQSKSTNVGAIVGGVIGGFCGIVALLGILLFRRCIFNHLVPPSLTNAGQHPDDAPPGYSELGGTMRTSGPPMRLYVRSTCFLLFFSILFFRGKAH